LRFDDVVGQSHISQTLKKALQTDHVAHAFLFCGPRGVGKTTCARILARVLNCQQLTPDYEACGECGNCRAFQENASFNIIELDAASNNSVENIRSLVEQVRFQPQQGRYKIYIIDEVHMLSAGAFNAFLKTLEEPPPYAVFILATTEKHKIIPTILSRCQIFDFKRIQVKDIADHLQGICDREGITAAPEALHIIAQKADGSLRDALSIFDRITSFSDKEIRYADVVSNLNVLDYDYFFRFTEALLASDLRQVMLIFDDILVNGFEGDHFLTGLAEHMRNLLVCKDRETQVLLEAGEQLRQRYLAQASLAPTGFLLTALNLCGEYELNYRMARNKRLHVELGLMKMNFAAQTVRVSGAAEATLLGTTAGGAEGSGEKKKPELTGTGPAAGGSDEFVPPVRTAGAGNETAEAEREARKVDTRAGSVEAAPQPDGRRHAALPTIRGLDILQAEAAQASRQSGPEKPAVLTLAAVRTVWDRYTEQTEKDSVRTILKGADLRLEDEQLTVTVGSSLAESLVRQETALISQLRSELDVPTLSMVIRLDPSRPNAAPAAQRRLSEREKYQVLVASNPLVASLQQRLDLRLEYE
jgi:DNA polymerase-3 subunit gamma/tau